MTLTDFIALWLLAAFVIGPILGALLWKASHLG